MANREVERASTVNRPRPLWAVAIVAACLPWACDQDAEAPGSDAVAADAAAAEEWTLTGEPAFLLGDDEAEPLNNVAGGLLLGGGRSVVGDGGSRRVLVVDSTGRVERIVGGGGEGPVEFLSLTRITHWSGDSVFVYDGQAGRYSVFSPGTGEGRTTTPIQALGAPAAEAHPGGGEALWLIGPIRIAPGQYEEGRRRIPIELYRLVASDSAVHLATLQGPELVFGPDGQGFIRPPLPVAGGISLAVGDNLLFLADGERPEVVVMDQNGETVREFEVTGMGIAIDDDLRSMISDTLYDRYARSEERMRSRLELAPIPERIDGFGYLVFARDGTLWVGGRSVPGIQMRTWMNLDTRGGLIRRLEMPRTTSILDADADRLLLRTTDILGVERVALRRIAPAL